MLTKGRPREHRLVFPTRTSMDITHDYRLNRVVLPKRIHIRVAASPSTEEKDRRYLSRSTTGLKFKKGLPDEHCVWVVCEGKQFGEDVVTLKGKTDKGCITTHAHAEFGNTRHELFYNKDLEDTQPSCQLKIIFTADRKSVYISIPSLTGYFLFPDNHKVVLKEKSCILPRVVDMVPLRYAEASEECKFEIVEPSIDREIHDVIYSIPKANLSIPASCSSRKGWSTSPRPPIIALETVIHNSNPHADSKEILTYSYQKMESGTWSDKSGTLYGWKVNFKTTVPSLTSTYELSQSSTTEHEWGETNGKAVTVTSSTEITVKAGQQTRARVIIQRCMLDVEFTYKQTVKYTDGTVATYDREGIYSNLESYMVFVEVSPCGNLRLVQPKTRGRRMRARWLRLLKKLVQ